VMQETHRTNLSRLADWLESNAPLLDPRPAGYLNASLLKPAPGQLGYFDLGLYASQFEGETCGSAGCAIGWASVAIEPRRTWGSLAAGESWAQFAYRLFGTHDSCDQAGEFMFGAHWEGSDNDPKLTAERIRYVLDHGNAPVEWGDQWTDGAPLDGTNVPRRV